MSPSTKDEVFSDESWLRIDWDPEHRCVYADQKRRSRRPELKRAAAC